MRYLRYEIAYYLFIIAIAFGCGSSNAKKNDEVKIMAHRGDWRNHPENSIKAIKSCMDMGIDIEIDVRKTKDGHFVVFHDDQLSDNTTGKGLIKDLNLDSIQQVFLKEGYGAITRQKIPTLIEVLQLAEKNNSSIYLDKAWEDIPAIYPLLKKYSMTKKVYFGSAQPYELVREKVGIYLDSIQFMPFVLTTEKDRLGFMKNYLNNTKAVKAAFVLIDDEPTQTKPLIAYLKKAGIKIMVSATQAAGCAGHDDEKSVDNPHDGWGWLIEFGAEIIFTDRPVDLKAYLVKKGLHPGFEVVYFI